MTDDPQKPIEEMPQAGDPQTEAAPGTEPATPEPAKGDVETSSADERAPADGTSATEPLAANDAVADEGAREGLQAESEAGQSEPEATGSPPPEDSPPEDSPPVAAEGEAEVSDEPIGMDWYILKVQSNREDSIREGLQRRVKIAGLEKYFGQIIVPTEKVTEFKSGKKKIVERKLYPGYLVVQMQINDDTWFLVRETPGIGDFTGATGHPTPMQPHEVARIVAKQEETTDETPKLKINFQAGDRVKINEGTFENFEGEVESIDETNGRVTVMINIFGRSTPVELEYWQIESV